MLGSCLRYSNWLVHQFESTVSPYPYMSLIYMVAYFFGHPSTHRQWVGSGKKIPTSLFARQKGSKNLSFLMPVFSLSNETLKRSKFCCCRKSIRLSDVLWQGLPQQWDPDSSPLMLDRHHMEKETTTLPVGLAEIWWGIEF